MTDTTGSAPTTTSPANKGVKQGLPATGLPTAEQAAGKLWNVARLGTATPEAFARQFGDKVKPSGGAWDTRMALLRGFKLLRFEGKQMGLSELGQRLVNSSDLNEQTRARRTAVLTLKAYRELVEAFNGTTLPEAAALASKLQFEYGKTEEFARRAAQAFIESLRHAAMLGADNVVHKDGVGHILPTVPAPAEPNLPDAPTDGDFQDAADAAQIDLAFGEEDADEGSPESSDERLPIADRTPAVSLALTLDLSKYTAPEVVTLLRTLGFGGRG